MEGQPPTKNGGSNDCRKFWMSLWPSLTGKSPEHPQSGTASDQTFFYSPEEVVNFNLHLSGDVGWFSNMISFAVISAASVGLKPRITNPLARAMKLSGLRAATGWCVAQSCL